MILKKEDIVEKLAQKRGATKKDARELLEDVLEAFAEEFEKGNTVDIFGFAKFEVKEHAARNGVSPTTGETIKLPAYKKLKFTPKKALKERIG